MLKRYDRLAILATAMVFLGFLIPDADARQAAAHAQASDDFDSEEHEDPAAKALSKLPTVKQWHADVAKHLARFPKYPHTLVARRASGITLAKFRIDHTGRLLNLKIRKSSGTPELDEAALQAIRAASPFPTAPSDYTKTYADFVVPLDFRVGMPILAPHEDLRLAIGAVIEVRATDPERTLLPAVAASLASQIAGCLQAPVRERHSFRLRLDRDGKLSEPPSAEDKSDSGRTATTSAGSELMKCKPFKLDAANYAAWQEIIVTRAPEARNKDATEKKRAQDRP